MRDHELTVYRAADAGIDAGKGLLAFVDNLNLGPAASLKIFEALLEQGGEELDCDHERRMFKAAAMKAVPNTWATAKERQAIGLEFDNAEAAWLVELRSDAEDEADYRRDSARDERMMGDAA